MADLRQNAGTRSTLERGGESLLPVYARYPVVMERGEGMYLFDSSGHVGAVMNLGEQDLRVANVGTMAGVGAS